MLEPTPAHKIQFSPSLRINSLMQKASQHKQPFNNSAKSAQVRSKRSLHIITAKKTRKIPSKAKSLCSPSFPIPALSPLSKSIRLMSSSPDSSPQLGQRVKIYTKTGDKGTSTLYNMERLPKNCDYFEALGHTDEINSTIGLAREHFINIPAVIAGKRNAEDKLTNAEDLDEDGDSMSRIYIGSTDIVDLDLQLRIIQSRLLDLGACIATPVSTSPQNRLSRVLFDPQHIDTLEQWIDAMDKQLPNITVFILPSGGLCASTLHVARTIARRAERAVVPLCVRGDCDDAVMRYLNRLSDYLFTAARYATKTEGKEEVKYKKPTARELAKAAANKAAIAAANENAHDNE